MKKRRILSVILLLAVLISSVTAFPRTVAKVKAATGSDVVRVAASQVGYHEKASNANLDDYTANSGSANYTKYARDLGVGNGQPWCAYFVWWCMQTAGVDSNNYPRVGYATRDWFRSRGLWHDRGTYTPDPGDYYFAPKLSKYRVRDRASSSGQMHLWAFYGDANAAQLFGLSMVKEPEYTETPLRTEQPLISSTPENPVHTEQPSKTTPPEFPVRTEQPTVTKTPSASQKPLATEKSWSTQMSKETNTGNQEAADISDQENDAMDEEDDDYYISKKPSQVRNLSLKNQKNRKIIVHWKKVSGVSGYQIQYAQNK